ncbi:MAG: ribosomal RNA small subunit methyltransferase A, partial [Oscillospiraceae bacterium]|nr:ribosomal RNA small subunit methyltransferase A [Oscillospiraceae bacterium]
IGPGVGCLTEQLCMCAKKVVSVEIDQRLAPVLAETMAAYGNFKLEQGDILKTDLDALCEREFGDARVIACANLPYYITSPAIAKLLECSRLDAITVMVQREVAYRICAEPGTAEYGAFTVFVQWYSEPHILLDVGRECFIPSPKVDSAVVRLDRRSAPPVSVPDEKLFFRVVKAAFAQRRKTLLNCLSSAFSNTCTKTELENCIKNSGIEPGVRGETLSIAEFARLSEQIFALMQ